MTLEPDFLRRITETLESVGVPYMTVGSVASSVHGEPRGTNDADIMVHVSENGLRQLLERLSQWCYVPEAAAWQAFRSDGMFNVIDNQTGDKADIILRKNHPFCIEGFRRRRKERFLGIELWVISPEDCILSKLEWCKGRGYDNQQVRDAAGVAAIQKGRLDLAYLRKWAKELGVEEVLEAVLKAAAG